MDLNSLVGAIYDAALDETRWAGVLDEFDALFQSKHSTVTFYDSLNPRRTKFWICNVSNRPEVAARYVDEYIGMDMASARIHASAIPDGSVLAVKLSPDLPGFEDPDYYQFCTATLDVRYRMASKLMISNYSIAMTSVNRGEELPAYSEQDQELYRVLTPHLARAFRIHQQLSIATLRHAQLMQTFKHIEQGVILLDSDIRLVFANEEAGRILQHHPALKLGRFNKLKAAVPSEDQQLARIMDDVLCGRLMVAGRAAPSLALHCDQRIHPLRLVILPLLASGLDSAFAKEGISLAIFVTDVERDLVLPSAYLQDAYQLTVAECEVAMGLVNGMSIAQLAAQRGVAEATVRWQVKCLLSKTGTGTQAELVRLLFAVGKDFGQGIV